MPEKVAELTIVLRARNLLKAQLDKADKQLSAQIAKIKQYQNEIAKASKAALAIAVVGGALFTGAVVQAAGFERALSNVAAVTKATTEEQQRLRDSALEQGSKSVFAASQAAEAQLFLGQAGQTTTQIIKSLEGVLSLAAATSSDLGFSAETTAATLSQFALDAGESGRVANVFAASAAASQATLPKLAAGLRQAGPIANSLGLSLEGTVAALNLLFNAGFKGEQAGTILRGTLSKLVKPTKESADILAQLGVVVNDSTGEMRPFVDVVEDLEKSSINTAEAITVFGEEAGPGLVALLSQGSKALAAMETSITGTVESTRQASVRTDNLVGSVTLLKSAVEGASISIGDKYIPVVRLVSEAITKWVTAFNDLDPAVQRWIANTALAATLAIGLAGAFGLLITGLALTAISFALVGTAVSVFFLLLGKGALIALAFFAGFKFGQFLLNWDQAKRTVLDFLQAFEIGWLGLQLVANTVIAAITQGLKFLFDVLRENVLKPLDLIFEGLIKLGTIDVNPFDSISEGLGGLESHTAAVVVAIRNDIDQVNAKYEEMQEAITQASEAQEALSDATEKVRSLPVVDNAAGPGLVAAAEAIKTAFEAVDPSIEAVSQKFKTLETDVGNARLETTVSIIDNATVQGREIRNGLQRLFASPITQQIIIEETRVLSSIVGSENIFAGDGLADFQFGSGTPDSFAKGLNFVPNDALVRVHRGEKILSRSAADQDRAGQAGSRSITFAGDINVYAATGQDVSEQTALAIRERIRKIDDLERG